MTAMTFLRTYGGRRGANVGRSLTCTWINGERPYTADMYCGEPSVRGYSFCEHHKNICYREVDPKIQRDFDRSAEFMARVTK